MRWEPNNYTQAVGPIQTQTPHLCGSDVEADNTGLVHKHLDMGVSHYWKVDSLGCPIEVREVDPEEFWNDVLVRVNPLVESETC